MNAREQERIATEILNRLEEQRRRLDGLSEATPPAQRGWLRNLLSPFLKRRRTDGERYAPSLQRPRETGDARESRPRPVIDGSRHAGGVGDPECIGSGRDTGTGAGTQRWSSVRPECHDIGPSSSACGMAYADGRNASPEWQQRGGQQRQLAQDGSNCADGWPGPVNGFWRVSDWLLCRDPDGSRWRPVEPGSFPLAHGTPARVGRLRGYGNALVAPHAEEFIASFLDCERAIAA